MSARTQRARRALDWYEAMFGDSEFVREWKRHVMAQEDEA